MKVNGDLEFTLRSMQSQPSIHASVFFARNDEFTSPHFFKLKTYYYPQRSLMPNIYGEIFP